MERLHRQKLLIEELKAAVKIACGILLKLRYVLPLVEK